MATEGPSTNGQYHAPGTNRFGKGNPGGPGNPHAGRMAKLRSAMIEAVTEEDVRTIIESLVAKAKAGDLWAQREVLDRVCGKAVQPVANQDGSDVLHRVVRVVLESDVHAG